jgi:hypothetical protein
VCGLTAIHRWKAVLTIVGVRLSLARAHRRPWTGAVTDRAAAPDADSLMPPLPGLYDGRRRGTRVQSQHYLRARALSSGGRWGGRSI